MKSSSEQGMTRREVVFTGAAAAVGVGAGFAAGYLVAPDGEEGTGAAASTETIKIGGAYPLTGFAAGDGTEMRRGAEMGVAEINERGGLFGRQLELILGDIEDFPPDKTVNVVERLLGQGISALFMGYTTTSNAEYPSIARAGIPAFHNNTFTGNADWVAEDLETRGSIFQICPTELPYGPTFATLLETLQSTKKWTPSKKSAAIVTSLDPYSLNIANQFRDAIEKQGWEISLFEKVNAPLSEWGPVLAKIRDNPPGVIFHADYIVGDLASFTKQFRSSPTPSLLYEQYGPSVPEYLDLTGDASNGVIWSTVIGLLPDEIGKDYAKRYEEKMGAKPGLSLAGAQRDAVFLWWTAAARAGDQDNYPEVVAELKDMIFRGVCGAYRFQPTNLTAVSYPGSGSEIFTNDPSLGLPNLTFQIQNGEQVLMFPEPYTVGGFQLPPWLS